MGADRPLLPGVDGRGRPWRDHRQVINGVLWRFRTGAPWRDLPERYGPWQTQFRAISTRFDKLAARYKAGVHLAALLAQADAEGDLDWVAEVDSTIVSQLAGPLPYPKPFRLRLKERGCRR